jgi:hypothetical protein
VTKLLQRLHDELRLARSGRNQHVVGSVPLLGGRIGNVRTARERDEVYDSSDLNSTAPRAP